ncbi:MAG TPA: ABC transporter permease [Thermoanaerobaculia bacterium]|nr:ABC transporter permease [Thermoanaerobaculia bacterium]
MLDLFSAELRRSLTLARRYPVEFLSGVALLVITFYAIFLGARYVSGPLVQFGKELDALIVGYCLWSLVLFAVNSIASSLQSEAMTGTLEQVYLSPFGALRVILTRALAGLGLNLVITVLLLVTLMLLTGRTLSFPVTLVIPLLTVLLAAYGLGLLMAGFALLAKRVGQFLRLGQFLLLFLVVAPVETFSGPAKLIGYLLPVAPGAGMLRGLMTQGQTLDPETVALAFLNGVAYFVLGLMVYRRAEREARSRGLLGQY